MIDHMRSDMAKLADQWIGIRSGTDGALALSMMHVIVNEGLYDEAFVRDWTLGFKELQEYVRHFPPEKAEKITRVPRETIAEIARSIARARAALAAYVHGLEYSNSGVQSIRAVLCLWAVTGNLDVPGGLMFRPPSPVMFPVSSWTRQREWNPSERTSTLIFAICSSPRSLEAPRAILQGDPYPVKALLIFGASLLTSLPDPEMWKRCFKKLRISWRCMTDS